MSNQSREYLIDASILIPYIRRNQASVARLDALSDKFISPTVVAELAFGAYRSREPIDGLLDAAPAQARRYSVLRRSLRHGSPMVLPEPLYVSRGIVVSVQACSALRAGMPANG